ncbi:MAG: hypothetical protein JXQ76_10320 [Campylobacterales bacterium]|nr:hypothetical protein [Campylobacterales bacterium]
MLRKLALLALFVSFFTSSASAKSLYFDGYTSYNRYGSNITLSADYIRNTRNARTGTLKMQLWATRSKYRGGYINGYIVGETTLDPLYANRYYRNVSRTVYFRQPPAGYYYMTLVLAEYRHNGQYQTMDYVNYRRQERF